MVRHIRAAIATVERWARAVAPIVLVMGGLAFMVQAVRVWAALERRMAEHELAINEVRAQRAAALAQVAGERTRMLAIERVVLHRLTEQDEHLSRCRLRIMDLRVAMETLVAAWPRKSRAVPPRIADWPDWPQVGGSIGSPMRPGLTHELEMQPPPVQIEP